MKTFTLLMLLACSWSTVLSQNFKPFKTGVGLGYIASYDSDGGALIYLEPGYRISDFVLLNLRLESAMISRGLEGTNRQIVGESTSNTSYSINSQFYFNDHYIRPFVGVGVGLYRVAAVQFSLDEGPQRNTALAKSLAGVYPRIGLDIGHFNLTADFNILPSADVNGHTRFQQSYFSLRTGISVGGGVGRKVMK